MTRTEQARARRAARAAMLRRDPSLAPHADPSTYSNWGCRCPLCSWAQSVRFKEWRAGLAPATRRYIDRSVL